ncbi:MAG: signal peptidase I [Ruminococcus sp.]|nr:signal peptidase I [Ruminococcus sp.]
MKRKGVFRRIINILSTVILLVVIAVVIFVFIARISENVPSIFGFSIFRVRSDSMTPTLQINDVILTHKTSPDDIHKNDIVTYLCEKGELAGETITHRVVSDPEIRGGVYYYVTQGDKTGAPLDSEISYDQIRGKYIQTLPFIDKLYTFFLSPYGLIVFILIIVVLFGYEMISLILSYRSLDEKGDDYYAPPNKKPSKKRKK